ncbi:MAG: two-component sensor histidine kinase [Flavobacteriaceae bacterium]|nr:two-component sensor histidine kinase [Flavobacteriaceae bacterium]|tara:strand:+ start:896 stop:1936 length:1041 start_codon:yes stop_codon:yes gene_type:complete
MKSKTRIRLQLFLYSFVLAFLLGYTSEIFNKGTGNFTIFEKSFLIIFIIFFVVSFSSLFFFTNFFIYKRVQEISEQIFPNDSNISRTVTTNMDEMLEEIKKLDNERKSELVQMREQENFRREFIGNLAHELKTPIFTSQSYILTLLDGAYKDKNVNKKYLKIAGKAIDRLNFIIKDLDLITKLETGDSNLKKSNFNIVQLIENVIELLEISASKKNIKLVVDHSPKQSVKVNADKEKIEHVLTNLIENSIKYGKESGTTEIIVQEVLENKLLIRVTDNGIGVENNNLERLFERFYRVDQTGNRSTGGSGLGLAIVKHIIDAHDEKIFVESELGVGSEFSFTVDQAN